MVRLCLAPLIHGNAQWAALVALFAGDTVVVLPHFEPHEVWRTIERRKVNVVVLIGDAMARPLIEAYLSGDYDASSLVADLAAAPRCSPRRSRSSTSRALPNVMVTDVDRLVGDRLRGHRRRGRRRRAARWTAPGDARPAARSCVDDYGRPAPPGVIGRLARGGHVPLGYYKDPDKTAGAVHRGGRRALRDAGRPRPDSRRTARSPCWAGATRASTPAARRSSRRRSRARSRRTRTSSTRWSSACRTSCSASGWRRWSSRARAARARPGRRWRRTCATRIAGYKVPRSHVAGRPDQPHPQRQGRLPMGAPSTPKSTPTTRRTAVAPCGLTLCALLGIELPDRRLHPVRTRRGGDQPGRRARRARLRPLQRPGRAGRGADLARREHRRAAVRGGHRDAHPRARPRARRPTWTS